MGRTGPLGRIFYRPVQSRSDRDDFVEIKWDNIKEDEKHNFKKHSKALTYGIPYDPLSIMHYESQAFAIDSTKPTIVSKVQVFI